MTVTVIALTTIAEDAAEDLAEYLKVTGPLLKRVGAKIIRRFTVNEMVVGHRPAQSIIMVEYPDRAAVDAVFGSAEYRSVRTARDRAFLDYQISIVEGGADTAIAAQSQE